MSQGHISITFKIFRNMSSQSSSSLLIFVMILQFKTMMHITKSPDVDILNSTHSIPTFTFFVLTKVEITIWVIVLLLYTIIFLISLY